MPAADQLKAAADQIRSNGAVAVLGAGLSAPRFPMTGDLNSLLWHAIDSDSDALARLKRDLGSQGRTAKEVIGQAPAALDAGWRVVESNRNVRMAFQKAFARLDADREPTPAHFALARLIKAGLIECVVSFNWDTALERAYEQLYGASLPANGAFLFKPHGDAATPERDWVLPHQTGFVSRAVKDRIAGFGRQRPRVLLIVGYSESDETVTEELLGPTERRWPVVRVGLSVGGPEAVTGLADEVLPSIADALNAPVDVVGWHWVGFARSRDLGAALLGYRLGPQDVHSCPALPAVRLVAERIRQAGFAVVQGDSGAGKSITAFQAAYELNRDGWAVIELSQPGIASLETVRTFQQIRGPVLAVVDDSQALTPDVTWAFERAASTDHAIIVVATDRIAGQERVRVTAADAVHVLVNYCSQHPEVVEPVVRRIDDRVGLGITQEPFVRRLKVAQSSAYPWQFMFVLSGGERRISGALANLASEGDADLLFGMLAASQLLSLDAGVTRTQLRQHASFVGHDDRWLSNALNALVSSRLVVEREGRFRTPHMRIADRGLLALCRNREARRWRDLIGFLRSRLLDAAEPLQGSLWMLRAIDQSDPLRYGGRQLLLDEEAASFLVERCLAAAAGRDRNIAAYLLWEIGWWHALSDSTAEKVAHVLPAWLCEVTSEDVFGIQWLLGGMRSNFPKLHGTISSKVTPEEVARRLEKYGSCDAGEDWGRLIAELAHAEGIDTQAWAIAFQETVDTDRVAAWVRDARGDSGLGGPVELANDLAWLAPRLAAVVVAAMTPALANRLERDVAGAARDLVPWAFGLFHLLGSQDRQFWDTHGDHRALREAVLAFINATSWEAVGAAFTQAQLHELDQIYPLAWSMNRVAPDAYNRMTSSVSLTALDRMANGHWHDFGQIEELVVSLSLGRDHEPAKSWVHRHGDEIQDMPTRIVPIAPKVAADLLARGGRVKLQVDGGLRWGQCCQALDALLGVSQGTALAAVRSSRDAIVESLALRQANMVDDLREFVEVLDMIEPGLLDALLEGLDPQTARRFWADRLAGSEAEATAANLLIERALASSGEIGLVAHEFLRAGEAAAMALPSARRPHTSVRRARKTTP